MPVGTGVACYQATSSDLRLNSSWELPPFSDPLFVLQCHPLAPFIHTAAWLNLDFSVNCDTLIHPRWRRFVNVDVRFVVVDHIAITKVHDDRRVPQPIIDFPSAATGFGCGSVAFVSATGSGGRDRSRSNSTAVLAA